MEKMLGTDQLRRLLIMVRLSNEGQLKIHCPFYQKLAEVPKAQRLGVLTSAYQYAMTKAAHVHLSTPPPPPPSSAGFLSNLITLLWHRVDDDSLDSELLGNPFLFGIPTRRSRGR